MTGRFNRTNWLWLLGLLAALCMGLGACSDDDTDTGSDSKVMDKDGGGPDKTKPLDGTKSTEGGGDILKPDGPLPPARKVILLHTNDLHDHLQGWSPNADYTPAKTGDDKTVGGFARLATQIGTIKKAAGTTPVLTLDAGDFTMGTLFTWLNTTEVPTMMMMQAMGYDVITLGNHEFDWTPDGLAQILGAAAKKGFKVPIVASNMVFDKTSTKDDNLETVAKTMVKSTHVKSLANGLKVGFFGIVGKGAASVAPAAAPVTFEAAKTAAAKAVKQLRETDKVDLVVAISHGGISSDGKKGDDWQMAYDVAGIDVIISGHTHTPLKTQVLVKNPTTNKETIIVQAGSYGKYLGKLELTVQGASVKVDKYTLVEIDDTIAGDTATQKVVDAYIVGLNGVLKASGSPLQYNTPIAMTKFDLTFPGFQETILGNIITDAYRVVTTVTPSDAPDVAFESGGVVRDEVLKGSTGKIWFSDLYRALPLGIGPTDQKPGYPLVSFYMTGNELKAGMELLHLGKYVYKTNDYYIQISGMKVEYQKTGGSLFNRVTKITMDKQTTPIDMTKCDWKTKTCKCYKIVTNYYVGLQLATVSTATSGLLSVVPKKNDCFSEITDMKERIIKVDGKAGKQELKAWQALLTYMSKFPKGTSGLPEVPASYGKLQNRIVEK